MKISFLCFDISDNSFARAALLADAVSSVHQVELLGPAKKGSIWEPLKNCRHSVKLFPWKRYPSFLSIIPDIIKAADGDLIFASKLRPTSFGISLLANRKVPILLDIDDWELGFFSQAHFWGKVGRFLNFSNPDGMPYTWIMEQLTQFADGITVSNRFLQKRFGGVLAPHCRDTTLLDPEKFNTNENKKKLGLEGKKTLMFLGTPRAHKGIDDLIALMGKIQTPNVHLAVIGTPDSTLEKNSPPNKKISFLPKIPFSDLGIYLSAADGVIIPQRKSNATIGQMPAKIYDAMAMAKPIISTKVSDIPEALENCGYVVEPGDVTELAQAVDSIFSDPIKAKEMGQKARAKCKELYDIKNLEKTLLDLIEQVTKKNRRTHFS
jgi:glycosyltransferase involved in cell wall biosynthesis